MSEAESGKIKFGLTQRKKPKLIDEHGYTYARRNFTKENGVIVKEYWSCTTLRGPRSRSVRCPGKFIYFPQTGEGYMTAEHWEDELGSTRKAKDAAIERLRELSEDAKDGDKPLDIVRKLLDELPLETLEGMPSEHSLIQRVRRHTKARGIVLGRSTFEDFMSEGEGEEDLEAHDDPGGAGPSATAPVSAESGNSVEGSASTGSLKRRRKPDLKLKRKLLKLPTPTLKLVDEDGRDLGNVPIDRIATAGEDGSRFSLDYANLPRVSSESGPTSTTREDMPTASNNFTGTGDEGDDWDAGGGTGDDVGHDDSFPMDFDNGQGRDLKPQKLSDRESVKRRSKTVSTSSQVKTPSKRPRKDAVKSGERCFVCGDELLVSETLSSSQETFRKACIYLNVRTKNEWFHRKPNGQFYSFCESCTNEISRIHHLYKNVEDMQSVIFKRVEQVEKRMTEAEILDNWLSDAPVSSAKRFEGFRKQVLINYKNKLKLRREVRMGTKMGLDFTEIQPVTSAHMFASDPAETEAFRKTLTTSGSDLMETTHKKSQKSVSRGNPPTAKRRRGRPKSKNNSESVEMKVESNPLYSTLDTGNIVEASNDNDHLHGFDDDAPHDDDDAMSMGSAKERKFWHDDPSKLKLDNFDADDGVGSGDNQGETSRNESNSDYEPSDDDEEWGKSSSKSRRSAGTTKTKRKRGRPSTKANKVSKPEGENGGNVKPKVPKAKESGEPKQKRKFHRSNIEYPDVVLSKDGRLFLSGIEIIKNPPGVYKRRPQSVSFSCGQCEKVIMNFHGMKSHICGHHLGLYTCPTCGKQISDARNLQRHILRRHSSRPKAPCSICGKPIVDDVKDMRCHIWYHLSEEEKKDPKYKSYAPMSKRDPNRRKANEGLSETYMCTFCSKTFHRIDSFRKHEASHTVDAIETFQCQFCGKLYNHKSSLRSHSRTCGVASKGIESQMKFPCLKCPVILKTKEIRIKHMQKFHGSGAVQPFACPKCPRRFSTRSGFKKHKLVCVEGSSGKKRGRSRRNINRQEQYHQHIDYDDTSEPSTSTDGSRSYFPLKLETEEMPRGQNPHHQALPSFSNSNSPAIGGANPSSSSAALLSGFGYNLFGNYPGGGGSGGGFQQQQQQHHH